MGLFISEGWRPVRGWMKVERSCCNIPSRCFIRHCMTQTGPLPIYLSPYIPFHCPYPHYISPTMSLSPPYIPSHCPYFSPLIYPSRAISGNLFLPYLQRPIYNIVIMFQNDAKNFEKKNYLKF